MNCILGKENHCWRWSCNPFRDDPWNSKFLRGKKMLVPHSYAKIENISLAKILRNIIQLLNNFTVLFLNKLFEEFQSLQKIFFSNSKLRIAGIAIGVQKIITRHSKSTADHSLDVGRLNVWKKLIKRLNPRNIKHFYVSDNNFIFICRENREEKCSKIRYLMYQLVVSVMFESP
jgi:hypothetical protein